ncbi:hypothetical protein Tco_0825203 [Tanacetum coccineum]
MESVKKTIGERAQHKMQYESRVNERQNQTTEEKTDTSNALDSSFSYLLKGNGNRFKRGRKQEASSHIRNDAHLYSAENIPIYIRANGLRKVILPLAQQRFEKGNPKYGQMHISLSNVKAKQALNVIADSDHNSSTSHLNDNNCLLKILFKASFPQDIRRQYYDNTDPGAPKQKCCFLQQKNRFVTTRLEFSLQSVLYFENITNQHNHGLTKENNNDQAPNASFQEAGIYQSLFLHGYKNCEVFPHATLIILIACHFNTKSLIPNGQEIHPLKQVRWTSIHSISTKTQLATDPEKCYVRTHDKEEGIHFEESFAPVASSLKQFRDFRCQRSNKSFQSIR